MDLAPFRLYGTLLRRLINSSNSDFLGCGRLGFSVGIIHFHDRLVEVDDSDLLQSR